MKVINEWDGAPAQTPTQIIRKWHNEHVREIYDNGIDDFEVVQALIAALAPLFSAGPWRTDAENAPKDGSELIIEAQGEREVFRAVAKWSSIHSFWATGLGVMLQDSDIRAFATINQPEIQG